MGDGFEDPRKNMHQDMANLSLRSISGMDESDRLFSRSDAVLGRVYLGKLGLRGDCTCRLS